MHTFPHRTFAICKVPTVNPSGKNQRFLPAPFGKGAFGCGIGGFPPNLLHIPSSLFPKKARYRSCGAWLGADNHQQVPAHPQAVSLAPAGSLRHLRCQLPPGGSYRLLPFHMGLYFWKVPTVNPSGKNQRFLPAPTGREPCGQCPLTISHDGFLLLVTSLPRPVSAASGRKSQLFTHKAATTVFSGSRGGGFFRYTAFRSGKSAFSTRGGVGR